MPYAAPTPCRVPRCIAVAVREGYCESHRRADRKQRDIARGTATKRGYGATWRKLRALVLGEEPLCRMCMSVGRTTAAEVVDHIVPRKAGGTDARENLQGLCKQHHDMKTAKEDERWGKR